MSDARVVLLLRVAGVPAAGRETIDRRRGTPGMARATTPSRARPGAPSGSARPVSTILDRPKHPGCTAVVTRTGRLAWLRRSPPGRGHVTERTALHGAARGAALRATLSAPTAW